MDYSLAALKLFCGQLKDARQTSSQSALTLGSILFQRAWLQGILVSDSEGGRFVLDDGSDTIELSLSNDFRHQEWKIGMYVMVVGVYVIRMSDPPIIKWTSLPQLKQLHLASTRSVLFPFWLGCLTMLFRVHKIVDLSPFPDREAMWHMEVIEAYKLFYQSSFEE